MHWLAHWLGLDSASGPIYLFWSGIAGDLGFLGAAFTIYRRHNCHAKGCWRIGKHPVDGTPYTVCAVHHPTVPNDGATDLHIAARARIHHDWGTRLGSTHRKDNP